MSAGGVVTTTADNDPVFAILATCMTVTDLALSLVDPAEICPPVDLSADWLVRAVSERLSDAQRSRVVSLAWRMGRVAGQRQRLDDVGITDPGASDGPALCTMMEASKITSRAAAADAVGCARALVRLVGAEPPAVDWEPVKTYTDRWWHAQRVNDIEAVENLPDERLDNLFGALRWLHNVTEMFDPTLKENR